VPAALYCQNPVRLDDDFGFAPDPHAAIASPIVGNCQRRHSVLERVLSGHLVLISVSRGDAAIEIASANPHRILLKLSPHLRISSRVQP
jgi:hypothetical protein